MLKNVTLIQVEHMDDVLKHALVLADPERFFKVQARPRSTTAWLAESKEELVDDEAEDDRRSPSPTNLS